MEQRTVDVISELRSLGMNDEIFGEIHHFSQPQFKSRPTSMNTHSSYSRSHAFQPDPDENRQTCRRLEQVQREVASGADWEQAVERAWAKFPLVTR